jgi:(R,R)-butanediol dehydrogenase/meso-butanediol dehydrogenase/diacetyl reductase
MRAVRLIDRNQLEVEEISAPSDPGPGEILLRNRFCGICGTDLHEYADGPHLVTRQPHPLTGTQLPQVLGHEFGGEVVAVGSGVDTAAVGDRVAVMPLLWCGNCAACLAGRQECCPRLAAVGYNWAWGGMAEYALVKAHQVAVLPDHMTDQQGALVEPTAVAVHAVRSAPVLLGDNVLVTGAGPIGQLVALSAQGAGASVTISEPNPGRRRRASALGGVRVLDPNDVDVSFAIRERHPDGVDVAIECAGNTHALAACTESVRPGGVIVQTALPAGRLEVDTRQLTAHDIALKGVVCFPVTSWPWVIELIASGRLPAERIITGEVGLEDAVDGGFAPLLDPAGDQIKILVTAG